MGKSAIISGHRDEGRLISFLHKLDRLLGKLGVRVALLAVLAALASLVSVLFGGLLPAAVCRQFRPDEVLPILTILAAGMLAVSTFSLNVMVTAHNAAASLATPRMHRILLDDSVTQTALAVFIGAFVYSLIAVMLLSTGLHSDCAAAMILLTTAGVVVLVVISMLRWIDHLSDLGSMDNILYAAEQKAQAGVEADCALPALGALPWGQDVQVPVGARPMRATRSGYIQYIDMGRLDGALTEAGGVLYLEKTPGAFVLAGQALGQLVGAAPEAEAEIEAAITYGPHRAFAQDTRLGLLVLSEIGMRALSAAVNDPGTALDVISRQERLLWEWGRATAPEAPPPYGRVYAAPITAEEMIGHAFAGIARDGAGMVEITCRLQAALTSMMAVEDERTQIAARQMSAYTLEFAEKRLVLESDLIQARQAAQKVIGLGTDP